MLVLSQRLCMIVCSVHAVAIALMHVHACSYIPIQVSKVIYIAINTHRIDNTADSYNMPIGRKNSCFSRSTLFADVQLRGTLIPEVSACKICHEGKLHMDTHTHTHTHTQICTHTCTHTYTHTRADFTYTHTYTNTCLHPPTNTIYMYTHMPGVGNLQKVVVYFSPTEALGGLFYSWECEL